MKLGSHKARWIMIISILSIMGAIVYCTKKTVETVNKIPVAPAVTILSPASDTTVESSADSARIVGRITDPENVGVKTLTVNDVSITVTMLLSDTFTTKVKITKDTLSVITTLVSLDNRVSSDTVTVYRKKQTVNPDAAKISGTLYKDAGTQYHPNAKRMQGRNAEGQQRVVQNAIPVSGADIMLYNSSSLSTASDTSVKTDSTGNWKVELKPGNYFAFAVYFDKEKLEIVTSAVPSIDAEKGKETRTDTQTAITDDVKPMLLTFLDDNEPNENNVFVANDFPANLPIVLFFSEPMTRPSAGDSVKGIVLGRVNGDSSELPMLDTVPVKKLWGPGGKELRLIPSAPLTVGRTYKVFIPSTVKDLALNKMANSYSGIFKAVDATVLPPFVINKIIPRNWDTIVPGFPIEAVFSRPIDVLSLNKNYVMTLPDTLPFKGYWESKGAVARFMNVTKWKEGAAYGITIKGGAKDLLGDSLGYDSLIRFVIKPKDTFEQIIGIEGQVAQAVKLFMGAYMAGDLDNFAKGFHKNLELIEYDQNGKESHLQLDKFLEMVKTSIAENNLLVKFGFSAPVYYYPKVNGVRLIAWKLTKGSTAVYIEDFGSGGGGIGKIPKVIKVADSTDITNTVTFIKRAIVVGTDTLIFEPDMSQAFLGPDVRKDDPKIFGKLLKEQTNVVVQDIMVDFKRTFTIKSVQATQGVDSAKVMLELMEETKYKDGKFPFPITDPNNPPPVNELFIQALQFKMINEAGKWLVIQIVSKKLWGGDKQNFNQNLIQDTSFKIINVQATRPIEFVKPLYKAVGVPAPVVLRWAVDDPKIKGYLVAISNEMTGGQAGLLMFTRAKSITLDADCVVDSTVTVLAVDPKSLHVPLPPFCKRLASLKMSDSAVYTWKVVAIGDSTPADVLKNTFLVIADSDFGSQKGIGIFTMLPKMPDITNLVINKIEDHFSDRDGDKYPDWLEKGYGTNPDDPGQFPNFMQDSDRDGYPDFMETIAQTNLNDTTSKPEDLNKNGIADVIEKRPDWKPELGLDNDKDGFPNEIEILLGSDPNNPNSKPGITIKPTVPVGQYYGGIRFGDQNSTAQINKIFFGVNTDQMTGDIVIIDSTKLEGVAKGGKSLQCKLYFISGEWVYYIPLVNGPYANKFIKVRFKSQNNVLLGPVDMADVENGGGQSVGNFGASKDSTVDLVKLLSGNTNQIIVDPNQTINLGPPPADKMKRPDTGAVDLSLSLTFDPATGKPGVKAIAGSDTLADQNAFWQPGQWPALGMNFQKGFYNYHLDGNLFKIGGTQTNKDTLVLVGCYMVNKDSMGVKDFRNYSVTLLLTGWQGDIKKPVGIWTGWYSSNTGGQVNKDPLPFIGTKGAVDSALALTGKKAVIKGKQEILMIDSVRQEGTIWCAKVGLMWYLILETPGDWQKVFVTDAANQKVIVIATKDNGGVNQVPPFKGDSLIIVNALTMSNNTVLIMGPQPVEAQVDPGSLRKMNMQNTNPPQSVWVVNQLGQPKSFMFMGIDKDSLQLNIMNGKPLVSDFTIGPEPNKIPYMGDSLKIAGVLAGSNNIVSVVGGTVNMDIPMNPSTLRRQMFEQKMVWVINSTQTRGPKMFMFLGMENNPNDLKVVNGKALVRDMGTNPVPVNVPYTGDSLTLVNALGGAINKVSITNADGSQLIEAVTDPVTLRKVTADNKLVWVINTVAPFQKTVMFLGVDNNQNMLKIINGRPVVLEQGNIQVTKIFQGDSVKVAAALAASNNIVSIMGMQQVDVTVDPATLRKINFENKQIWIVDQAGANPKSFKFVAADNDTAQLKLINGKPVVMDHQTVVGNIPYQGDSISIVNALKASNNMVSVPGPQQPTDIPVNPASLRKMMMGQQSVWVIDQTGRNPKSFRFLGNDQNPNMLKILNGKPVVMEHGSSQQDVPYQGDSLTIVKALTMSNTMVRLAGSNPPADIPVNLGTVRKVQATNQNLWVIDDQAGQRVFKFMAPGTSPTMLKLDNSRPVVTDFTTIPQDVPYQGDSVSIVTALTASTNMVRLKGPSPQDITVNPGTIRKMQIQQQTIWVVDAQTGGKTYQFIAPNATPTILKLDGGMPLVIEAPIVQQDVPYAGDSNTVVTALAASNNLVRVGSQSPVDATVNPATLRKVSLQQQFLWIVDDQSGQKSYKFLANSQTPNQVKLDNSKPVVTEYIADQDPYMGDSLTIVQALSVSGNIVRVLRPLPGADIEVDPATLKKYQIPNQQGKFAWVVTGIGGNPPKVFYFVADIGGPNQLKIVNNKPAVQEKLPKRYALR